MDAIDQQVDVQVSRYRSFVPARLLVFARAGTVEPAPFYGKFWLGVAVRTIAPDQLLGSSGYSGEVAAGWCCFTTGLTLPVTMRRLGRQGDDDADVRVNLP